MKTLQELTTDWDVFEYIKNHLLTQGGRSMMEDNTICAYLSPDGKKCAVGSLITEDNYNYNIEESSISTHLVSNAVQKSVPNWDININMLGELQSIHDGTSDFDWEMVKWYLDEFESDKFVGDDYVPDRGGE
jgi:hypothetical protein